MSGGRATVARTKGEEVRQSGDICAVAPEGHRFTNDLYIECKFLKICSIDAALEGKGDLLKIWREACKKAKDCLRFPVLVIKRNHKKPLWITCATVAKMLNAPCKGIIHQGNNVSTVTKNGTDLYIFILEDVLKSTPPKSWTGNGNNKTRAANTNR